MRIKKLVLTGVMSLAIAASADVLKWQVGSAENEVTIDYAYAQTIQNSVDSYTGGKAMNNVIGEFETVEVYKEDFADAKSYDMSVGAVLPSTGATDKYFFIELYNASGDVVGQSSIAKGSDLTQFMSASSMASDMSAVNAWSGGTFRAVPEPTSGLLVLLGAAVLGLRRKKLA